MTVHTGYKKYKQSTRCQGLQHSKLKLDSYVTVMYQYVLYLHYYYCIIRYLVLVPVAAHEVLPRLHGKIPERFLSHNNEVFGYVIHLSNFILIFAPQSHHGLRGKNNHKMKNKLVCTFYVLHVPYICTLGTCVVHASCTELFSNDQGMYLDQKQAEHKRTCSKHVENKRVAGGCSAPPCY